jgi:hypothetical protein
LRWTCCKCTDPGEFGVIITRSATKDWSEDVCEKVCDLNETLDENGETIGYVPVHHKRCRFCQAWAFYESEMPNGELVGFALEALQAEPAGRRNYSQS